MKKSLAAFLLAFLFALAGHAQKEQDFASRFMELYGKTPALQCVTVSPDMMGQVLQLPEVKENGEARELLRQLKSVQVVECAKETGEAEDFFRKAVKLAKDNAARYKMKVDTANEKVYFRSRRGQTVEMVLLQMDEDGLSVVAITGNMTADFLRMLNLYEE